MVELADTVYALDQIEKQAEHFLKELRKTKRLAESAASIVELEEDYFEGVKTEFCSGKGSSKQVIKAPLKRRYDPEAYDKIMMDLGVAPEVYLAELVRPHWPAVQEHYNRRLAAGENVPVKVDETTTLYEYKVRKRKEIV